MNVMFALWLLCCIFCFIHINGTAIPKNRIVEAARSWGFYCGNTNAANSLQLVATLSSLVEFHEIFKPIQNVLFVNKKYAVFRLTGHKVPPKQQCYCLEASVPLTDFDYCFRKLCTALVINLVPAIGSYSVLDSSHSAVKIYIYFAPTNVNGKLVQPSCCNIKMLQAIDNAFVYEQTYLGNIPIECIDYGILQADAPWELVVRNRHGQLSHLIYLNSPECLYLFKIILLNHADHQLIILKNGKTPSKPVRRLAKPSIIYIDNVKPPMYMKFCQYTLFGTVLELFDLCSIATIFSKESDQFQETTSQFKLLPVFRLRVEFSFSALSREKSIEAFRMYCSPILAASEFFMNFIEMGGSSLDKVKLLFYSQNTQRELSLQHESVWKEFSSDKNSVLSVVFDSLLDPSRINDDYYTLKTLSMCGTLEPQIYHSLLERTLDRLTAGFQYKQYFSSVELMHYPASASKLLYQWKVYVPDQPAFIQDITDAFYLFALSYIPSLSLFQAKQFHQEMDASMPDSLKKRLPTFQYGKQIEDVNALGWSVYCLADTSGQYVYVGELDGINLAESFSNDTLNLNIIFLCDEYYVSAIQSLQSQFEVVLTVGLSSWANISDLVSIILAEAIDARQFGIVAVKVSYSEHASSPKLIVSFMQKNGLANERGLFRIMSNEIASSFPIITIDPMYVQETLATNWVPIDKIKLGPPAWKICINPKAPDEFTLIYKTFTCLPSLLSYQHLRTQCNLSSLPDCKFYWLKYSIESLERANTIIVSGNFEYIHALLAHSALLASNYSPVLFKRQIPNSISNMLGFSIFNYQDTRSQITATFYYETHVELSLLVAELSRLGNSLVGEVELDRKFPQEDYSGWGKVIFKTGLSNNYTSLMLSNSNRADLSILFDEYAVFFTPGHTFAFIFNNHDYEAGSKGITDITITFKENKGGMTLESMLQTTYQKVVLEAKIPTNSQLVSIELKTISIEKDTKLATICMIWKFKNIAERKAKLINVKNWILAFVRLVPELVPLSQESIGSFMHQSNATDLYMLNDSLHEDRQVFMANNSGWNDPESKKIYVREKNGQRIYRKIHRFSKTMSIFPDEWCICLATGSLSDGAWPLVGLDYFIISYRQDCWISNVTRFMQTFRKFDSKSLDKEPHTIWIAKRQALASNVQLAGVDRLWFEYGGTITYDDLNVSQASIYLLLLILSNYSRIAAHVTRISFSRNDDKWIAKVYVSQHRNGILVPGEYFKRKWLKVYR